MLTAQPPLNEQSCKFVPVPFAMVVTNAILCSLFSLVTVVGNVFIIGAVLFDPTHKRRSVFTYFIVNLATSDFLTGCIAMPLTAALPILKYKYLPSKTIHTAAHLCTFVSAMASLLSLTALSLDRFAAIKWPFHYRNMISLRRFISITMFIWVLSVGIPMLYFHFGYLSTLEIHLHIAICVSLPVLVLIYYNVRKLLNKNKSTLRKLQMATGTMSLDQIQIDKSRVSSSERKVTRVFLLIILLFVGCYLPAIILDYICKAVGNQNCELAKVMTSIKLLLILLNSGINPIVCILKMKQFRLTFRQFCKWCFMHNQQTGMYRLPSTITSAKLFESKL